MANDGISVPYNRDLKALEELLSGVRRPGDFFVQGSLEAPMPRVVVEGVGVISFPVPEAQIQQLIQQATRAPYGRGKDTLHDETVRKTWQLPASQVRLGGKAWEKTFSQLLATVMDGLGCAGAKVSAELYKLLIYDRGGFFAAHRDTEKADGMFGTLVVVLPSAHRGGELVKVIVPALALLHERERKGIASDAAAGRLWVHAAEFLLTRSETPPAPPTDWRFDVKLSCKCEDCRGLQAFVLDAQTQVARFRVRQDRRQHLHQMIEKHQLDMTHVTERKGSPQTLVCTKTRRTFQRQCGQHRADCASMNTLLNLMRPAPAALSALVRRLACAKELKP